MNQNYKKKTLLIGLGSQGKAWAFNLRDSGHSVDVFLRSQSSSHSQAEKLNLKVFNEENIDFKIYDFILILIPDDHHLNFLTEYRKALEGANIVYAHGFSVHYGNIDQKFSELNHILLAPKAIASEVRYNYETSSPLAAVLSYEHICHNQSETIENVKTLAKDLGVTEILERSFKEETEADLFSEQAILCSLIPFGAKIAFEKMLERGISKELAYIECWHEVRLIANAMIEKGPKEFFNLISPNALVGGIQAKDKIFSAKVLELLDSLFDDIQSQKFFHDLQNINFQNERKNVINELESHPLQSVYEEFGRKLK